MIVLKQIIRNFQNYLIKSLNRRKWDIIPLFLEAVGEIRIKMSEFKRHSKIRQIFHVQSTVESF